MASPKIFVSSTCYDLGVVRSQLRSFLLGLGYEPVMSEFSDILFDPRIHTHTSCIQEVSNCDLVVLIVGARYGGHAVPSAVDLVDVGKMQSTSTALSFFESKENISVTQLEITRAIQSGVPIFTFVDSSVMHDHLTYEKNKHKSILSEIEFPSIEKQETAVYIFEFINFLRMRASNNSLFKFSKIDDIESTLRKQWSALFQRLLFEKRDKAAEVARIDDLSSQIADLKIAFMTSIESNELKEAAKGAIRYRLLIEFIAGLSAASFEPAARQILKSELDWRGVLESYGIVDIQPLDGDKYGPPMTALIRKDGTYYQARLSQSMLGRFTDHWSDFRQLGQHSRDAIINAVLDLERGSIRHVRFIPEKYETNDGSTPSHSEEALLMSKPPEG